MGKNRNILISLVLILFTGSVFITSGIFVNPTTTTKFYFVVVGLFILTTIIIVNRKWIKINAFTNKTMLRGIISVCFAQACYGLCQFLGWFPSNHSKFIITGSFDNPAGFAAVLAIGFPIGLYLLTKTKRIERYFVVTGLIIITLAIILSGSRTGILAIIISSMVFLLFQTNIGSKFQELKYYKLLLAFIFGLIAIGAFMLYFQKKDSANGRLLIWKVSSEMIKDKPIFGHGYRAFQAKYMDYQADYFKNNPNSKYAQLADNVKHPFNEFIKVVVEFGIIGFAIILSFILFVFWKTMKSKNKHKILVYTGLVSFLVFACFSYPLQYIAVWLLLLFYISALFPSKGIKLRNTPVTIIIRSAILIACVCILFITHKQIRAEIRWKTIAVNSLKGNTEEMLPEYGKLYLTSLKRNPFFLYNYGAELNVANQLDKSIEILTECQQQFNDYDLQMLLADNYYKKGKIEKAVQLYQHASNMVPSRFLPLFQIFEIYKNEGKDSLAIEYANMIINKKVKVASGTVSFIKSRAMEYLNNKI